MSRHLLDIRVEDRTHDGRAVRALCFTGSITGPVIPIRIDDEDLDELIRVLTEERDSRSAAALDREIEVLERQHLAACEAFHLTVVEWRKADAARREASERLNLLRRQRGDF